jgi:MFS family permease
VNISGTEAVLQLGFADGRTVEFAIRDGRMLADGRDLGPVPPHRVGDREWRDLLNRSMDTPAPQLAGLFRDWRAPASDGALKDAILAALAGKLPAAAPAPPPGGDEDSVAKLESRLQEMQTRLQAAESAREEQHESWTGPFRYIWRGLTGLIATLVMYAILLALGFGTIYFGGRPHIEAVADAARRQTARSLLVGLAASFLVVPAFVLGILVLLISIVGIPALLLFVPLFPVAVIVGCLLGYLGVAHAAGELLAERRLSGGDWFSRGNSYYFVLTGVGLLLAPFLAGHVIQMAGPWLGFIHGLLMFVAVVLTWFALTTGLGAVLLTRFGTRSITGIPPLDSDIGSAFEEESHV